MDYHNLPQRVQRIFKKAPDGHFTLPTKREMIGKFFAFIFLVPGISSCVMSLVTEGGESVFLAISAGFFLSLSLSLFGRMSRLGFDRETKQLYLTTSWWWGGEKRHPVSSFDTLICELGRVGEKGVFQVTLVDQMYEFQGHAEAYALLFFLSTHYQIRVVETISDWPNKTVMDFGQAEEKFRQDSELADLSHASNINFKDPVFIEVWDRKTLFKLLLPFFVFTAIAGLVKYGVL